MSSIYIHIPFCKHICTYCDFAKLYYDEKWVSKYLDSLEKEIKLNYKGDTINTMYVGGGTPSSLPMKHLKRLFGIIKNLNYGEVEFTFECNLEDIDKKLLELLKENGVNRLSIGVESFSDDILKFLGRTYSCKDIIPRINIAKKYFSNINIDLIYAIPGEKIEDLENDIDNFLKLNISHISTYSLMIEPHTVIYNKKISNIDEDLDRKMYDLICTKLKDYDHYEISNFSKKGFASKHNLVYWNNQKYYGFGLGAGGYIDNYRYLNTRNMDEYIKGNYILEKDILTKNDIVTNAFILGLRKVSGINKKEFRDIYNLDINKIPIVDKLIKENKLIDDGTFIKINNDLLYVSNSILVDFIEEDYYE